MLQWDIWEGGGIQLVDVWHAYGKRYMPVFKAARRVYQCRYVVCMDVFVGAVHVVGWLLVVV